MEKKVPTRLCLGCRQMYPKRNLIRIIKSPDGQVSLDLTGKASGRGAYLCNNPDCLKKAIKTRAVQRAFETELNEQLIIMLEGQLSNYE